MAFCKNFYPREFSAETTTSNDAYPKYKRKDDGCRVNVRGAWLDNRWVVPYSPYLLEKFDWHMNIEVFSTVKVVKYMYKYICKSSDKILFNIGDQPTNTQVNEIKQYTAGRWVCAPEALWRIYRFPINGMNPVVLPLQCHLENFQPIVFNKKQQLKNLLKNPLTHRTMPTQYFSMNTYSVEAKLCKCTYGEFPDHFFWHPDDKVWTPRTKENTVGRIVTVHPIEGERYYLRLLLGRVRCPTSYLDLRTYEGKVFPTFQASALARGFLQEYDSHHLCMNEASAFNMPYELRRLFATLLVYSTPNDPNKLWLEFEDKMSEDIIRTHATNKAFVRKNVLASINKFLESMGKNLHSYGIVYDEVEDVHDVNLTKELQAELNTPIS